MINNALIYCYVWFHSGLCKVAMRTDTDSLLMAIGMVFSSVAVLGTLTYLPLSMWYNVSWFTVCFIYLLIYVIYKTIFAMVITGLGRKEFIFNKSKMVVYFFMEITVYNDNNQLHRLDGPAILSVGLPPEWYYLGEKVPVTSQKDFKKWLKLRTFL